MRSGEIWQISRGIVRDFSCRRISGKCRETRQLNEINGLDSLIWRSLANAPFQGVWIPCGLLEYLSGEDFFTGQAWCGLAEDW